MMQPDFKTKEDAVSYALRRLKKIKKVENKEIRHIMADEVVTNLLNILGAHEVAVLYTDMSEDFSYNTNNTKR